MDATRRDDRGYMRAAAASAVDAGLVVQDAAGVVLMASETALRLLGQEEGSDSVLRLSALDARGESLPVQNYPPSIALRNRTAVRGATVGVCRDDGAIVWLAVTSVPVFAPDGDLRLIGVVTTFTEIGRDLRASDRHPTPTSALTGARRPGELMDMAAWEWNIATGALRWSASMHRIAGLDPATTPTWLEFQNLVHPEDLSTFVDAVTAAVASRGAFVVEHRIQRPGGEIRHLRCHGEVRAGADGEPESSWGTALDITEITRMTKDLHNLTRTDFLTGTGNRVAMEDAVDDLVGGAALILVDIDDFKLVNDRHGHPVGDQVLRQVAGEINDAVSADALVARMGGDEFAVLVPGLTDPSRVRDLLSLFPSHVQLPPRPGLVVSVRLSMGWSVSSTRSDLTTLYGEADSSLYRAKTSRGGQQRTPIYDAARAASLRQGQSA